MALTIQDIFPRDRAALAPLAGITGSVFRRICRRYGASPVMTEMISADGVVYGPKNRVTLRLLDFREEERPLGYQLFGSDPVIMGEAAGIVLPYRPDFIDINVGCPVKKVVTRGAGSALMNDTDRLEAIVRKVVDVVDVPVTVKIRSGWDFDSINAVEVARMCADAGAAAIILHPRPRSQGFSGRSDWSLIDTVRRAVTVPVIGSGDIKTPEDALSMRDDFGADSVMIGRRAMNNPWIFRQVAEIFDGREVSETPGIVERLDLALEQLVMIADDVSERFAVLNMRKFFGWYSKGARGGAEFRQTVFRAETIDEVVAIVKAFQETAVEGDDENADDSEKIGATDYEE